MRQKANEGLPHLGQKTLNAPGKTLSEMNVAQTAFSLNPSSVVCLPLVSDTQRLVWVSSNEINLQLDGADMLSEAFDRFPYLTQKQTAALARRCSLHQDQVRVWFMAQRLRYGISWDYKDIPDVRQKMSGLGKEEPKKRKKRKRPEVKEDGGENKKGKRKKKHAGGKKGGEVWEEQGASEGKMMGEKVRPAEKLEIETKPMKKEKGIKEEEEEDIRNPQKKKRKKMTVTDEEMKKKRVKQEEEGVPERAEGEEIISEEAKKETARLIRQKKKTQLAMMKAAFSNCQYPDVKDYDRLAALIDMPRYLLVQWFGDMRYYIKKFQPRWLNNEQYNHALANIRYRQYLTELVKMQPQVDASAGDGEATWKLDGSESSDEEESVPEPPEEKVFYNL
ncbi:homeobox and leucine zipper encoding b [Clinocottus analis]|uniref:homeobox and leucine zipper encoding b n=1 Tax=Clinocottus analis TaxID=304258 RepID=UPI0035C1B471